MFGGQKNNRKLLAGVAAATLGAIGGASASFATLTADIRYNPGLSSVSGLTVDGGNKSITLSASSSGTLIFDVYMNATGANGTTTDEGFGKGTFRLVSSNVNGGVVTGNMGLVNTGSGAAGGNFADPNSIMTGYNGGGGSLATLSDVDLDGDLDLGGSTMTALTNMAVARFGNSPNSIASNLVYRFSMNVGTVLTGNGASAQTLIKIQKRQTAADWVWKEDAVNKNGFVTVVDSDTSGSTSSVVITLPNAPTNSSISLTNTPSFTNVADDTNTSENPGSTTVGAVHVTGSLSLGYTSEIDGLTANLNKASAVVDSGIVSPVYAMLWLTGSTTDVQTLLGHLTAGAGGAYTVIATGADQWNPLQTLYPGFNALVEFNSGVASGGALNWDFAADTAVTVDRVALVPEPTGIAAALIPAAGLLTSRRRRSRKA